MQHTGSFKLRGAYNAISQSAAPAVVAYSSGNHAQGVARAARLLGRQATIVMPADAPAVKLANTRADGAVVRLYDRRREIARGDRRRDRRRDRGRADQALRRPARHRRPGHRRARARRAGTRGGGDPDAALIPCGGGGLIAGCSLALAELCPDIEIYAVEPAAFDDTRRSLAAGVRVENPEGGRSICDALLVPSPGELTFALNRRLLAGGLVASDAEVRRALAFAFAHLKLVVEPGGAVALAALLAGAFDARGRTVGVVLSGGNVDPALFAEALGEQAAG